MISQIAGVGEKEAAVNLWRKVFRTTDPFTWPFQSSIGHGRILFPTDGYHLTALQYKSLMQAIRSVNESSFLLAIVESDCDYLQISQRIWNCELPEYAEYCSLDIALENAIISPSGRWGVIISHEMHGVLGASAEFLSSFNQAAGDGIDEKHAFGLQWCEVESQGWLETLLKHVA